MCISAQIAEHFASKKERQNGPKTRRFHQVKENRHKPCSGNDLGANLRVPILAPYDLALIRRFFALDATVFDRPVEHLRLGETLAKSGPRRTDRVKSNPFDVMLFQHTTWARIWRDFVYRHSGAL